MKGWDLAVVEYAKTKHVNECPYCKGKNVSVTEYNTHTHRSLTFICNDCKKVAHYDGHN